MKTERNKKFKQEKGYSLVEILIVIFVLGVGLVGILAFFNTSIINHTEAKNELIAASLSQEGVELVRNLADNKKLGGSDWISIVSYFTNSCGHIDYRSLTSHACQVSNNYICYSSGQYQQCSSGTGIGMTRTISFSYNASEKYLQVTSEIKWNDRTTTAIDRLYENNY